jgi:hypothetical protein
MFLAGFAGFGGEFGQRVAVELCKKICKSRYEAGVGAYVSRYDNGGSRELAHQAALASHDCGVRSEQFERFDNEVFSRLGDKKSRILLAQFKSDRV